MQRGKLRKYLLMFVLTVVQLPDRSKTYFRIKDNLPGIPVVMPKS